MCEVYGEQDPTREAEQRGFGRGPQPEHTRWLKPGDTWDVVLGEESLSLAALRQEQQVSVNFPLLRNHNIIFLFFILVMSSGSPFSRVTLCFSVCCFLPLSELNPRDPLGWLSLWMVKFRNYEIHRAGSAASPGMREQDWMAAEENGGERGGPQLKAKLQVIYSCRLWQCRSACCDCSF